MKQLAAVLCLALLSLANAVSPVIPVQPLPIPPLLSEDCNATEPQASWALDEINKDRDEGFVLSLYRVVDAHRQPAVMGPGNIFFLTIDVLETDCHVLSGKRFKDCHIRSIHRTVFGRCKAIVYINLPWRTVKLYSYSCTLSSVPPAIISRMCPDCPVFTRDTDSYTAKAESMVATYNKESNNTHYFKLDDIERAAMQWVFKASYYVEFTVKETNCSRLETDVTHCEFLDDEHAHVGFCKGSMPEVPDGPREALRISVTCEIYDPKSTGHPHHKHHDHHGKGHHGPHGHGHHHHHHHHHPHGHNETHSEDGKHHHKEDHEQKHGHGPPPGEPHNHHDQKHHGSSSEEHTGPKPAHPPAREPISTMKYYQMENATDFFPDPVITDPSPPVDHPEPPVAAPTPFDPFKEPVPYKFPLHPSDSPGCPAKPKHNLPLIEPLFPVPAQHPTQHQEPEQHPAQHQEPEQHPAQHQEPEQHPTQHQEPEQHPAQHQEPEQHPAQHQEPEQHPAQHQER